MLTILGILSITVKGIYFEGIYFEGINLRRFLLMSISVGT